MAWVLLVIAGFLEVGWALGLEATQGFTRLIPSVLTIAAIALSMYLLSVAARTIPIGTAYAVWVGIGVAGASTYGMLMQQTQVTPLRVACLVLLLGSVVGLKIAG